MDLIPIRTVHVPMQIVCSKQVFGITGESLNKPHTSSLIKDVTCLPIRFVHCMLNDAINYSFCPAGIIAFTDGVSGFNSSSSMHSTITEMRTNNISCWIFRAGSTDTASWGWVEAPLCYLAE